MSNKDEQTYEVEKIIGQRIYRNKIEYKVRWLGYGSDEDSWEKEDNLNCPDLIEKYKNESAGNKLKTASKGNSWENLIKSNPPVRIVGTLKFFEEDYLRVQLKNNTYATFTEKFIQENYPNISK